MSTRQIIRKNIYFSLRTWRLCALARGISVSEMFHISEHLRKPRKLSRIVVRRPDNGEDIESERKSFSFFVLFVSFFVVISIFPFSCGSAAQQVDEKL